MRATSEVLDDNKVRIAVEIDEQEVEVALASKAKALARDVKIPGFRPGRAPRPVVEARIGGAKALRDEAMRELLPDYYARAVSATEVEPISSPELKVTKGEEEGPVEFDAVVEVRPQLQLAGYDKLRVTIPSPVVTDDEVDEMIDRQREPDAVLEAVARPIVTGDFVTMDVRGRVDSGQEVVNVDDYVYVVGQGSMVDEADNQLPGMRAGETLEVAGSAPGGAAMSFTLTLKDVREKRLPDLTDEWVAENTERQTVHELRDDYMGQIRDEKVRQARRYMRDATMAELATRVADDEVPDALVEHETSERFDEFQQSLQSSGMSYDDFFRITHQDPEEFANLLREEGQRSAKVDLALRSVAAQEQLEPSDEELDAELDRLAATVRRSPDKLREELERSGRLGALRAQKAKSLAAEFVIERVTYVDPEGAEIDPALLVGGPLDEADTTDAPDALDQSQDELADTTEDA